MTLSKSDSKS